MSDNSLSISKSPNNLSVTLEEAVLKNICVCCKSDRMNSSDFRDPESFKESENTLFCQNCQDWIFSSLNKNIRPSQIMLGPIPLVGVYGKMEIELAGAAIIRTCQFHGDEWKPVSRKMMQDVYQSDIETRYVKFWEIPSFILRPNFHLLVDRGFARWIPNVEDPDRTIEMTQIGINKAFEIWGKK